MLGFLPQVKKVNTLEISLDSSSKYGVSVGNVNRKDKHTFNFNICSLAYKRTRYVGNDWISIFLLKHVQNHTSTCQFVDQSAFMLRMETF